MVVVEVLHIFESTSKPAPPNSYHQFTYERDAAGEDSQALRKTIETLVQDLHDEKYVHGDLQVKNFYVKNDTKPRTGFMLLDFDWSGEIGVVRYPMWVNRQMRRPEGARDGEVIAPEHDREMVNMSLNLDIWFEILQYFSYPEDKDTLRSLATASRCLSELALDRIWRDGKRAVDIVSMINSFAPSPNKPYLVYKNGLVVVRDTRGSDDEDSSFTPNLKPSEVLSRGVLNKSLPHAVRNRVLQYLARIIRLTMYNGDRPFNVIWPILSASLNPFSPLLPNLQHLGISYTSSGSVDRVIPLLSSPLKTLRIERNVPLPHVRTILHLAKSNGCDLEQLSCYASFRSHLEAIASFENLKSVRLLSDSPIGPFKAQKAPTTIINFLTSLPSLRSLSCNLGAFSPSLGGDRLCHNSLQKLNIRAQANELHELFHRCALPSVINVTIRLTSGVLEFEDLASNCPNTRELDVDLYSVYPAHYLLESKKITPLLSLPIQTFKINVTYHDLTPSDLHTFIESWQGLRSFRFRSASTRFNPWPSLPVFSSHPCLEYFTLIPFPLCHFLGDITKLPHSRGTYTTPHGHKSRIRSLCFSGSKGNGRAPVITMAEKRMFVEYLVLLFPNLEKVDVSCEFVYDRRFRRDREEFNEILLELTGKTEKSVKAER